MSVPFLFLPAQSILRDSAEIQSRYQRNVTALTRSIPMVVRPGTIEELSHILSEANTRRIALYPISTGKNWGLGSKLPVVDGIVLDLSRLNRIIEVNEPMGYAVIEPGVTQTQLARHLAEHHPGLTFNLTGTFGETSILGNTLDHGDGGLGARIDDLIGVRGLLGSGKPFEVGGHFGTSGSGGDSINADAKHVMRYVAGPDMVGLFTQSNFAIVTQIVFRLIPRADQRRLFYGAVEDGKLTELYERLRRLFAQRIINPAMVNVGYANRFEQARSTLGDTTIDARFTGELWNFYVIFDGSRKLSQTILKELYVELDPCCIQTGCYLEGDDPTSLPPHLKPLVRPLSGQPDDESIRLIYRLTSVPPPQDAKDMDVDQTPFGMKSFVGVVPPLGDDVTRAARIVATIRSRFKVNIKPSFFGDGRFLCTIHFLNTDPGQVFAAEQADNALWDELANAGYMPYRIAVNRMESLMKTRPEFFELVSQLKNVFDPNHIIAPGRYCPTSNPGPPGTPGAGGDR